MKLKPFIVLVLLLVVFIFCASNRKNEKEETAMITSERKDSVTPNGGDYSEIFYFDEDGNSVDKEKATKAIIKEYKKDGTLICETFARINRTEEK